LLREREMKSINAKDLRIKIDEMEQLLSKEELIKTSISHRLKNIRKHLDLLIHYQEKGRSV